MQTRQSYLRSRKLRDIEELIKKPYPGIKLHLIDDNLDKAYLVLSPLGQRSLHLRISFPDNYPLVPPTIIMSSEIAHPSKSTSSPESDNLPSRTRMLARFSA